MCENHLSLFLSRPFSCVCVCVCVWVCVTLKAYKRRRRKSVGAAEHIWGKKKKRFVVAPLALMMMMLLLLLRMTIQFWAGCCSGLCGCQNNAFRKNHKIFTKFFDILFFSFTTVQVGDEYRTERISWPRFGVEKREREKEREKKETQREKERETRRCTMRL